MNSQEIRLKKLFGLAMSYIHGLHLSKNVNDRELLNQIATLFPIGAVPMLLIEVGNAVYLQSNFAPQKISLNIA